MNKRENIANENTPFYFESAKHINVECIPHIQISMEIVLVTEGTLHITAGGKEYDIPSGFGAFIPPFEPHKFTSKQKNRCHVIMFSNELVNYFFEYVKEHSTKSHIFPVSRAAMELTDAILPDTNNSVDYVSAEAVLAPLCYDIIRSCTFEPRKYSLNDTAYRIIEYIDEHFFEDLTLETVARAVGVHPVTISKIFSKQTGVNFHYYLQYQRCTYAAKLIKKQNMSFAEIAYDSGFGSIRSFNRAFQAVYGMSPTQYKAESKIV